MQPMDDDEQRLRSALTSGRLRLGNVPDFRIDRSRLSYLYRKIEKENAAAEAKRKYETKIPPRQPAPESQVETVIEQSNEPTLEIVDNASSIPRQDGPDLGPGTERPPDSEDPADVGRKPRRPKGRPDRAD